MRPLLLSILAGLLLTTTACAGSPAGELPGVSAAAAVQEAMVSGVTRKVRAV